MVGVLEVFKVGVLEVFRVGFGGSHVLSQQSFFPSCPHAVFCAPPAPLSSSPVPCASPLLLTALAVCAARKSASCPHCLLCAHSAALSGQALPARTVW